MAVINIAGRLIGGDHEPIVIAEIGINHGGNLDLAISMADAAISSGAEIIKHQTHVIEDEMSVEAKSVIPGNASISIYEIMQSCALSETDEFELYQYVTQRGRIFMSTPFSRAALYRLQKFDIPAIKIGSGECNNYPLIKLVATLKKPVILSTGMNSIQSILPSVEILRNNQIPFALLHCTNVYPTSPEDVRLGAMLELGAAFPDAVIGLSDHTLDNNACLAAAALGASIVERHFTDSMSREGPDIVCSMDPRALEQLIVGTKSIAKMRGGKKGPIDAELPTINFAFASVVAEEDLHPGAILTEKNIWLKRPSGGDYGVLDYERLIGKKVIQFVARGRQVSKSAVDESDE